MTVQFSWVAEFEDAQLNLHYLTLKFSKLSLKALKEYKSFKTSSRVFLLIIWGLWQKLMFLFDRCNYPSQTFSVPGEEILIELFTNTKKLEALKKLG